MTEQPETAPVEDDVDEVELGDPTATDTGDLAAVAEADQAETDDEHPANEPVDVSDVTDDGQVLDVTDDGADG